MSDTVISSQLVRPREEVFTDPEALALAGFLSDYSGLTRDAYALDLRQFAIWCRDLELHLFASKRVHIEAFARDLEAKGRSRATIARRLCTVTCFYRYAEQEGLIEHSPAVHVRRARLDYGSHAVGLDRNELGAMLVAAGLAGAWDHALIALLAMNGLRVSEAAGANIERLGMEHGHRTLTVLRKGGKTVTMPMSPRTARAVDLAVGERFEGPVLLGNDGERLDRHAAARIVRRIGKAAGINKKIGPHTLRHGFITAALDAGSRCATFKRRPRTQIPGPRCVTTGPGCRWTGTPRTSCRPSSPELPAEYPARQRPGQVRSATACSSARSMQNVASFGCRRRPS